MKKMILLLLAVTTTAFANKVTITDTSNSESLERLNKYCLQIGNSDYRHRCILGVSQADFFQEEIVQIVEKIPVSDNYYIPEILDMTKNQVYAGIVLSALKKCINMNSSGTHSCISAVHNLRNDLSRNTQNSKTYRLPDDVSMAIPTDVVVWAGESFGRVEGSTGTVQCNVYLLKDAIGGSDVRYPQRILVLNGSNITLGAASVNIQILNDKHFGSITCSGAQIPDPRQRQKLTDYFKAGGVDLKIPAPRDAN